MSISVVDVMIETLIKAGARRCYGIVGDTINHLTDSIRAHAEDLEWVHVRHEEVGALAAGGEAYITGNLALCAGTSGPGSLHFLNGIYESHRNGAPLVMIASTVERREEGLNFPQEVDQKHLYEQCSVFCERIAHPDQARRITAMAAQAALLHRGVAVIVVNGDLFTESCEDETPWHVQTPSPEIRPNPDEFGQLLQLIRQAERITLYAGIGARWARQPLVQLAEKLQAPIAHSSRAKEFIEPDNPYNVGMTGILGNRAGMEAVLGCDLLLCIGTDFAYRQFYPDNARIVQIDINPGNIGKRCPVDLGLIGDAAATLAVLVEQVQPRSPSPHLQAALEQWRQDQQSYEAKSEVNDDSLVHPQHLTQMLNRLAPDNACFTADGGSPMVWLLRHLEARGERSFLTSLMHGTMANAYPQALGIAKACPGRPVIALCGDGGLSMLLGDLLTLVQQQLPVKLLVFNNGSLAFVEMEQRVAGLLDAFTELDNPDFARLAQVCGLHGFRVEQASELESNMQGWLDSSGPALLDVRVNRMELVMPPKVEAGQVASTALFGIKAVLSGRGDEVVELLRDNFIK